MLALKIIIWLFLFIIFYAYLGYGMLLFVLVKLKRRFKKASPSSETSFEPEVTLFVAAYNEKDFVDAKIRNSLSLEYPHEKVRQVWITDGSDDGTAEMLKKYEGVEV